MLLSVLVCGSNSVIGYYQYRDSIQDQYNEQAYNAAEVALSYVDLDDLRRYVKLAEGYRDGTVSRSEIAAVRMATAYQRVDEQMLELQVAMGASDIMIFALDVDELMSYNGTREGWEPLLYIFDNYHDPSFAKEVGGDFYDFFLVDNDHLALVMADVSGKGVPAALFMMISKTCWL